MATPLTNAQLALIHRLGRDFVTRLSVAWWLSGRPPVRPSSYLRTPQENESVGGHRASQHLIGTAMDVVGPENRSTFDGRPAFTRLLNQLGLTVLDQGTHLHVQLFPSSFKAVETIAPQLILS